MTGTLLAVHIADGVLAPNWWIGGWVGTAALLTVSAWRLQAEEIPRLALVSAAVFVASSIHVPLPMTSVHLLLNSLAVLLAGCRAALAIFPALLLQALLLNHGGLLALGINTLVYTLPALTVWATTWVVLRQLRGWKIHVGPGVIGVAIGALTVLLTVSLNAVVLYAGGIETWPALATLVFLAHLPVVLVESCVTASLLAFLVRVKPGLLCLPNPDFLAPESALGQANADATPTG